MSLLLLARQPSGEIGNSEGIKYALFNIRQQNAQLKNLVPGVICHALEILHFVFSRNPKDAKDAYFSNKRYCKDCRTHFLRRRIHGKFSSETQSLMEPL